MRLSYEDKKFMQVLAKQGLLKGAKTCKLEFCEHCVLGKKIKVKFGTAIHRTRDILDYVNIDVWVPFKNVSLGDKHYFVSFVDDYSRRNLMYTMSHKREVLDIFVELRRRMELQTDRKIKILRSDNGGVYKCDLFLQLCHDEGIERNFTVRETPQ